MVKRTTTALIALVALAVVAPAAAQDCYGNTTICREVNSETAIRAAAIDPLVEDIILTGPIELQQSDSGSLQIEGHATGEYRTLTIRSDATGPHALSSSITGGQGLIQCWPDNEVHLFLQDIEVHGYPADAHGNPGGPTMAVDAQENCHLRMEQVHVHDFYAGEGAVLSTSGYHTLDIARCRFSDIEGTAIQAWGGQLYLMQTVFTNCSRGEGPGGVWLSGAVQASVQGNVFWGCVNRTGAGGALRGDSGAVLFSQGNVFGGNYAAEGGAVAWDSSADASFFNELFVGNATCPECAPESLDYTGIAPAGCNHQVFDTDADTLPDAVPLPANLPESVEEGAGGAIAVYQPNGWVDITKCAFVANVADRGGALAVLASETMMPEEPDDFDVEGPGSTFHLIHSTFAENVAEEGAAVFAAAPSAWVPLLVAGNLWMGHDNDPLVTETELAEAGPRTMMLAYNHNEGPPLSDGLLGADVYEIASTCGAKPQLTACPTGCDGDAEQTFCHESIPGQWSYQSRPTLLNVEGFDLCLEETTDPCLEVDEDGCAAIDGPCAYQAGTAEVPFGMPDGTAADLGWTGGSCVSMVILDNDADGWPEFLECDDDSDPPADEDATRHPLADEVCNGLDDNCDGQADEGLLEEWYEDTDGDGYGGGEPILSCDPEGDLVRVTGDCDDGDATISPQASEAHGDGVDNDCDGVVDVDAPGCHNAGCLATRVAPGEDGVQFSAFPTPLLFALGGWSFLRSRSRMR